MILECDELWSFVGNKRTQAWLWSALDRDTREIVGVAIGERGPQDRSGALGILARRLSAMSYLLQRFLGAYRTVLPSKRHRAVGKARGQTNHVERINNTLRQRIGRLVRKTLAFSKKLDNHSGAIWYFIHQYNASPKRGRATLTTC